MRSLGQNPTVTWLHDLIKEIDLDLSGSIDFEEFKMLMVSKVGDCESRAIKIGLESPICTRW
ncbi:MAG: EF-hand domain-containing protein [Nostoc sp.]|uniref:EF-hand domain-containing protein n=1 Tax=Nostoc sp. TaxID=1180 RepID=UPI002FFCDBDF